MSDSRTDDGAGQGGASDKRSKDEMQNGEASASQEHIGKRARMQSESETETPHNFLTYLLKGRWLGTTMLMDINSGQVTARYLTVSRHGINGTRFSRLTQRVHPDGRVESSFFAGRFEDDFNVAVFTTTATQWKMKEADEDVVIITALADIDNLPPNSLLSDALITRLADGVYIHTRQIMVGNSVQMESTRTRRITGENLYFESEDDAPPLDTSLLQPHLEQLRALKHQAQAQKHELGIESSWTEGGSVDTPDDQSLAGDEPS